MSQYHIRELTLLNINEYTFYIGNREESFQEHITPLNYLFIQMDQIHQELIVYHVQFDDNETEYLDSIAGNMSYITNEAFLGNMINRYRTIVSSVNLALYHILNLTIDEQTGEAGFVTRIEAFVDMLFRKKRANIVNKLNIKSSESEYTPNTEFIETKSVKG